jgi:hypothetical protein
LTESSDDAAASDGIIEDIAALARKLAEKEPFKSASGPEALLALASRLDGMVATTRRRQPVVSVAVRSSRKKCAR